MFLSACHRARPTVGRGASGTCALSDANIPPCHQLHWRLHHDVHGGLRCPYTSPTEEAYFVRGACCAVISCSWWRGSGVAARTLN